jgi:hypothetical protein
MIETIFTESKFTYRKTSSHKIFLKILTKNWQILERYKNDPT